MKIPTAEIFFEQGGTYPELAIAFAKLHVKAALEAVSEKAYCELRHEGNSDDQIINKQSIFESYPEELIK